MVCEVEVDAETGAVHVDRLTEVGDCGVVVNPRLLAGQLHGGIVHGLGNALMEEAVYDGSGQLLSATLMDYALPRADDLPSLDLGFDPTPCTTNPLGVKGCGEAGAIAAFPAIANAILEIGRAHV